MIIIFVYSNTSFIGTLIYRDLHLSGSRNLIYRDILFLLQPPLLVHSYIVCRCFICRSFIMSIFLHTFICVNKCQHTTRVMATHHETVCGSGEPLQIPINEVFTFQGRPDKWGFTVCVSTETSPLLSAKALPSIFLLFCTRWKMTQELLIRSRHFWRSILLVEWVIFHIVVFRFTYSLFRSETLI